MSCSLNSLMKELCRGLDRVSGLNSLNGVNKGFYRGAYGGLLREMLGV